MREWSTPQRLQLVYPGRPDYSNGPAIDWPSRCVSAYASSHPWEDWAETWAHYLHMIDALETAAGFGISLKLGHPVRKQIASHPETAFGSRRDFNSLIEHWFPLTYALNSVNRGMGLPDLYPFVLSAIAIDKLRLVHDLIEEHVGTCEGQPVGS